MEKYSVFVTTQIQYGSITHDNITLTQLLAIILTNRENIIENSDFPDIMTKFLDAISFPDYQGLFVYAEDDPMRGAAEDDGAVPPGAIDFDAAMRGEEAAETYRQSWEPDLSELALDDRSIKIIKFLLFEGYKNYLFNICFLGPRYFIIKPQLKIDLINIEERYTELLKAGFTSDETYGGGIPCLVGLTATGLAASIKDAVNSHDEKLFSDIYLDRVRGWQATGDDRPPLWPPPPDEKDAEFAANYANPPGLGSDAAAVAAEASRLDAAVAAAALDAAPAAAALDAAPAAAARREDKLYEEFLDSFDFVKKKTLRTENTDKLVIRQFAIDLPNMFPVIEMAPPESTPEWEVTPAGVPFSMAAKEAQKAAKEARAAVEAKIKILTNTLLYEVNQEGAVQERDAAQLTDVGAEEWRIHVAAGWNEVDDEAAELNNVQHNVVMLLIETAVATAAAAKAAVSKAAVSTAAAAATAEAVATTSAAAAAAGGELENAKIEFLATEKLKVNVSRVMGAIVFDKWDAAQLLAPAADGGEVSKEAINWSDDVMLKTSKYLYIAKRVWDGVGDVPEGKAAEATNAWGEAAEAANAWVEAIQAADALGQEDRKEAAIGYAISWRDYAVTGWEMSRAEIGRDEAAGAADAEEADAAGRLDGLIAGVNANTDGRRQRGEQRNPRLLTAEASLQRRVSKGKAEQKDKKQVAIAQARRRTPGATRRKQQRGGKRSNRRNKCTKRKRPVLRNKCTKRKRPVLINKRTKRKRSALRNRRSRKVNHNKFKHKLTRKL